MNKFLVRYYLVFLTTFSFSVFSLKGKTESSKSDVVSKRPKESKKRKGAAFAKVGDEEIRMLRRLLELPPERLKMLRRTIERLENYTEEERKSLKEKLTHFNNRTPEERSRNIEDLMRRHALLKEHMERLSPSERASRMKRFQSLNLIEKKRFLDDLNNNNEEQKKP